MAMSRKKSRRFNPSLKYASILSPFPRPREERLVCLSSPYIPSQRPELSENPLSQLIIIEFDIIVADGVLNDNNIEEDVLVVSKTPLLPLLIFSLGGIRNSVENAQRSHSP
jgi:hypothetical protein